MTLASIVEQEEESEPDELGLTTAAGTTWVLDFASNSDERFTRSWCPDNRILFGTLEGWQHGTVHQLRAALIRAGRST